MKTFKEYYTDHIHNCGVFDYPYNESVKPIKDVFSLDTYYRSSRDFFNVILAVIATISKYEVLGYKGYEIYNKFREERRARAVLPNCFFKAYKMLVEQLFTKIYLDKDKTIDEILGESFKLHDDICTELSKYGEK